MARGKATVLGPLMVGTIIYIFICFIGNGSGNVQATHFRGGTISWKPSDSFSLVYKEIIFTFKLGWRLSRIGCDERAIMSGTLIGEDARWFCMYGCKGVVASTREKCTEFNLGEDWMYGSNTFKKVFDSDGPIEISYMECCWLTDMVVGAGGEWALTTTLNLGIRSDTGVPNSSPVTAMAPMITLRAGVPDVIDLAVRDSDGDKVTCRLGRHVGECGTICRLFAEFTLDQENCLIRYTPVSNTTGKIPVAIMVEDHHRSTDGITMGKKSFAISESLSSVPMQFLVILQMPPANCSDKPLIETSIPSNEPVKVRQGKNFAFTVRSTPCDVTSSIEDFILIAPVGVRKSPTVQFDGVYTTHIAWTPVAEQDGSNLICVRARSSNGVLSEQICITVEVPRESAFCAVVGGSHFITFDKSRYNFYGMCKYKLVGTLLTAGTELTPFNVTLSNKNEVRDAVTIGTLETQAMGQKVTIENQRDVYLNGVPVNLPIRIPSGLRVEKSGRGVSVTIPLALKIYTDDATISVQLTQNYAGQVEGLCGNFNAEADDDLMIPGGSAAVSDEVEFAINFQVQDGNGASCVHASQRLRDQPECSDEIMNTVMSQCAIISEKNSGCFSECHDIVNPQHFYDNCINVFCESLHDFTALDVLIRAYANACQREGVEVCDWRTKLGITMECAPYSHYEKCGTTVPATCADSLSTIPPTSSKSCVEGCVCDQGYILSGSICVPESDCGCVINDIYYPKGFTYRTEGCEQECVCGDECREVAPCGARSSCAKGTDGFYRCLEKRKHSATCKAVTDPHYQTFDGKTFDSMGTCAYIMVRSKRNATKIKAFTVIAVNEQSKESVNASHVKEVHIHFKNGHTLTFLKSHKTILNDKELNPGSSVYGVEIRRVGRWVVADFDFGLVVRWDGVDMLRVTVWSPLRYMVEGMCGDWDGNPDNDFEVRPTTADEFPHPQLFSESWKVEGYGTEHCIDSPTTTTTQPPCNEAASLAEYQEECRGLINPKGAFEACHALVDPVNAFDNCVFDLCVFDGDKQVKERIFSSYAEDCLDENGTPPIWRDVENLVQECVNGVFSECANQCQPTCSDPTASQCLEKEPNQLGESCREGCVCQEGHVLSGSVCVPIDECGCKINGRYEKKGFSFAIGDCTQTCVCEGPDSLVCRPTSGGCLGTRDSCQRRKDGYFECVRKPRRRATCKAVTDPHYMTFDRKNFDSMGSCSYIMVKSKEESNVTPFQVVTVNEQPWPNRTASHVKEAWIHVGDDLTISMKQGGVITLNGRVVEPGTNSIGVHIRKVGRFWVADFPDIGFYVKWDGQDRLRISVWSVLREKVEGLCGDFNDDDSNDFITREGELVENITSFVNSWEVSGYENDDCVKPQNDVPEDQCSVEDLQEYIEICGTLGKTDSPYAPCLDVIDPGPFTQNCVFDLCASGGDQAFREKNFAEYVDECRKLDVTIRQDWREADDMQSLECNENSRAVGEADQCQPTCSDRDGSKCRESGNLGTELVEGCVCEEGYIRSGDKCVPTSECGCVAEDGTYFQQGFVYRTKNCSTECVCGTDGAISCSEIDGCPKEYRCRMDTDGYKRCIKHIRRRATCKAVTDPHYMTFDGIRYDSMGTCAYMMVRSKVRADVTPFRVVAVNEKPANVKHTVSHVKEIFVHIGDDITLSFKAGPVVTINNEVVLPGTTIEGIDIRQVGRFTVAELPFGLIIRWDGIDRLRVMAWANLKGMMEGLCGDFNDDPSNDFMTPDGVVETNLTNFVNSWKVGGYNTQDCEDPTENVVTCKTLEKLKEAEKDCRVLIDPEGPFFPCFVVQKPQAAYNDCVVDMCAYNGDPAIRERIISSYAVDCMEEAVADEVPPGSLDFREPEDEDRICEENSHFESCTSPCQPTCSDKDGSVCRATSISISTTCVAVCVCDEGFILSGTTCIREEECGCEIDGRYVPKGFGYNNRNCTIRCTCIGKGEVSCSPTGGCEKGFRCRINDAGKRDCVPHIRRRATCKAVTDPHYMSFDGRNFDSMGTCAYIMTQSIQGATIEKSFRVVAINERPVSSKQIVSHVKEVHIFVGKDFKLSFFPGPVVQINDEQLLPGSQVQNVHIRKVGKFTVAEFDFGLVVKWDGVDRLRIMAWASLKGQVEGICGDFNDDPENDFTTPSGRIDSNIDRFVRSWRAKDLSPPNCLELKIPPDPLNDTVCSSDMAVYEEYFNECSILNAPDGSYAACHKSVSPDSAFDNCLYDMCHSRGDREMFDRNMLEYSSRCLEAKVPINDTVTICPPNSTVAETGMEECQPTCTDPDASQCRANSILGEELATGCRCDSGLLLGGNQCIPPESCGCLIDNKYREKGFRYLNDECTALCMCAGVGDIVCIPTDPCLTSKRCMKVNGQYKCVPRVKKMATCKAITDPHYTTFDGKVFDTSAWCAYTMVQGLRNSDAPDFRVVVTHEREAMDKSSSRVAAVNVEVGNDFEMEISRALRVQRVKINGVGYNAGSTVQGVTIRHVGLFTSVEFPFGLVIRWDATDRLRVTVWEQLKGMVEGLCGRYNDNADDDFTMENGQVTNNVTEFVTSWYVDEHSAPKCAHMQDDVESTKCTDPDVRGHYEDLCDVILDIDGPFAECHRVADPKPTYDACVADLCRMDGDLEYKDRVFTSYVHDCHEFSTRPEPWRFDENHPIGCSGNSKYARCMHQCQPTCNDPDASLCKKKLPYLLGENCVEGCKCNSDFFLSNDKCVLEKNCGCTVDGVYHVKGFKFMRRRCTQQCVCLGQNVFECDDFPEGCLENRRCKIAAGGYYQCMPGLKKKATCKAITDPHYTSFDGAKFDSQGVCSYVMVRSKADITTDPFSVVAINEQRNTEQTVSHVKEVHIDFKEHRLSLFKGQTAELDGVVVNVGTRESGMKLEMSGRFLAAYFNFGLSIKWDGIDRLHVTVRNNLRGQVEGVCGDYDGDPTNDLMHAISGEIVADPENFVNSWRAFGFDDNCAAPQADFLQELPPPFECGANDIEAAEAACSVVINPEGALKICRRLADTKTAFENCVMDMCAYAGDSSIHERVISDFSDDCRQEGGELDEDWRKQANLTEVKCPSHSHFESCMDNCQPSCWDLDASECRLEDDEQACVEGCVADEGYVISGDEYVPVSECGCFKDNRYYKNGERFYTEGCKTLCECKAGVVHCRISTCAREEECIINSAGKRDCVKIETSTCQAWGSTHITSFDGRTFSLRPNCIFTLAKRELERGDPSSRSHSFILSKSITVSDDDSRVVESRSVRLRFPGLGLSVLLKPDAQTRIGGKSYYNWRSEDKSRLIRVDRRGSFTVVTTFFGLEVAYDGNNIRVTLPKSFAGKTIGLCGNFNGDPKDDFYLKDGSVNQDLGTFAMSYGVEACSTAVNLPPSTCSREDRLKWGASTKCGVILDLNSEFSNCSKNLDAGMYFEKCVEDVCRAGGSSVILGQAIKSFAHQCAAINKPVCDWRRNLMLQIACPVNSHYVGCSSACEETCGAAKQEECRYQQVEDCVCDEGYVRSYGQCVAKAACGGCLINRQMVSKGFSYRREECSKICTCVGNEIIECEEANGCISRAKCAKDDLGFPQCILVPRKKARCQAFGNGHFISFDGTRFDTTTTCAHILAKSKSGATVPEFSVKVDMQPAKIPDLSRVTEVIIIMKDLNIIMAQGWTVMVNGRNVAVGSVLSTVAIRKIGRGVAAVFNFGLTVRWDGRQNVRIEAERPLAEQVEGLCGDFNEDETDDYRTPAGVVETDSSVFVNSWRNEALDSGCRLEKQGKPPCNGLERLSEYKAYCEMKYSANVTSYAKCNLFEYCLFEMCATGGDREYIASTIYTFYKTCSEEEHDTFHPLTIEVPVVGCSANSHFNDCMSQCQATCSDQNANICMYDEMLLEGCVSGCQCDNGFLLDGEDCVKASDCGCVGSEGEYYPNKYDSYLEECDRKCQCTNGFLNCEETRCYPGQYCGYRNDTYGCHWEDKCKYDNGGCDQICTWAGGRISCSCREGYNLSTDGMKCSSLKSDCDTAEKNFTEWKTNTMQLWINKLDTYMEALREGAESEQPVHVCKTMWTIWFDIHDPDEAGDEEILLTLRKEHPGTICDNPVSIEAQLIDGRSIFSTGLVIRKMSASEGLQCFNSDQDEGKTCGDFRVRFLCLEELI